MTDDDGGAVIEDTLSKDEGMAMPSDSVRHSLEGNLEKKKRVRKDNQKRVDTNAYETQEAMSDDKSAENISRQKSKGRAQYFTTPISESGIQYKVENAKDNYERLRRNAPDPDYISPEGQGGDGKGQPRRRTGVKKDWGFQDYTTVPDEVRNQLTGNMTTDAYTVMADMMNRVQQKEGAPGRITPGHMKFLWSNRKSMPEDIREMYEDYFDRAYKVLQDLYGRERDRDEALRSHARQVSDEAGREEAQSEAPADEEERPGRMPDRKSRIERLLDTAMNSGGVFIPDWHPLYQEPEGDTEDDLLESRLSNFVTFKQMARHPDKYGDLVELIDKKDMPQYEDAVEWVRATTPRAPTEGDVARRDEEYQNVKGDFARRQSGQYNANTPGDTADFQNQSNPSYDSAQNLNSDANAHGVQGRQDIDDPNLDPSRATTRTEGKAPLQDRPWERVVGQRDAPEAPAPEAPVPAPAKHPSSTHAETLAAVNAENRQYPSTLSTGTGALLGRLEGDVGRENYPAVRPDPVGATHDQVAQGRKEVKLKDKNATEEAKRRRQALMSASRAKLKDLPKPVKELKAKPEEGPAAEPAPEAPEAPEAPKKAKPKAKPKAEQDAPKAETPKVETPEPEKPKKQRKSKAKAETPAEAPAEAPKEEPRAEAKPKKPKKVKAEEPKAEPKEEPKVETPKEEPKVETPKVPDTPAPEPKAKQMKLDAESSTGMSEPKPPAEEGDDIQKGDTMTGYENWSLAEKVDWLMKSAQAYRQGPAATPEADAELEKSDEGLAGAAGSVEDSGGGMGQSTEGGSGVAIAKSALPSMAEMMKSIGERQAEAEGIRSGYRDYGFRLNGVSMPIQNGYRQVFIGQDKDHVMPAAGKLPIRRD